MISWYDTGCAACHVHAAMVHHVIVDKDHGIAVGEFYFVEAMRDTLSVGLAIVVGQNESFGRG